MRPLALALLLAACGDGSTRVRPGDLNEGPGAIRETVNPPGYVIDTDDPEAAASCGWDSRRLLSRKCRCATICHTTTMPHHGRCVDSATVTHGYTAENGVCTLEEAREDAACDVPVWPLKRCEPIGWDAQCKPLC